jgi:transcriptional regulator with XRE-family HTH domain
MFKDNFKKIIQIKNLSAYKVSKETGIPKTIVYDWAAGAREPVSEHLITLADYLGVSIDYLLGRTDNPEINK